MAVCLIEGPPRLCEGAIGDRKINAQGDGDRCEDTADHACADLDLTYGCAYFQRHCPDHILRFIDIDLNAVIDLQLLSG